MVICNSAFTFVRLPPSQNHKESIAQNYQQRSSDTAFLLSTEPALNFWKNLNLNTGLSFSDMKPQASQMYMKLNSGKAQENPVLDILLELFR